AGHDFRSLHVRFNLDGEDSVLRRSMRNRFSQRRGQALIMVTLALIAMFGIMGLAVHMGWSFFIKKSAQRAADAAALGAAKAAFPTVNQSGPWTCMAPPCAANQPCLVCQNTPQPCSSISAGSNLFNGCQYAVQNGFSAAGNQMVRMTA